MTQLKVILEYDETKLGGQWMNRDNLELLLYGKAWSTHKKLLKIVSYEDITVEKE